MSIEQHLVIKVFSGQCRANGPAIHVVTGQQDNSTCKEVFPKICTHPIASSVPAGLLGNVVDWKFLFPSYPHVINVIATQIVVKL